MGSLGKENNDNYTIVGDEIFQISHLEKNYMVLLEINNKNLLITIMLEELSLFKWQQQFTIEQLQKLDKIFNMFDDVEQLYQPLSKWFKSYIQTLKIKGDSMYVTFFFELDQTFQVQFTFQLNQCEMNNNEVISQLIEKITSLQNKSIHQKDLLDQIQQESKKEIEQLKDSHLSQVSQLEQSFQQQLQKFQSNSNAQIQILQKEICQLKPKDKFSNILFQDEIGMIKNWITSENIQMKLELVYRASDHGFQIQKLYERCANKTPLVLVLQTTQNKRFGFYTDQQVKDYGGQYIPQNPNNLFIFSLDLKLKYTSNDSNNAQAFYFTSSVLALGGGHDFCLNSNSIDNASSYNNFSTYGKNQGVSGRGFLTGGSQNFTTTEIEIFQIQRV